MKQLLALAILFVGVMIYFLAPDKYVYSYSLLCGGVYVALIVAFYLIKQKTNYFDFDSIFFFTYFFVTLYYPIFMYETDATRYFMFAFPFNEYFIPKGSSMAVLGMSSYLAGSIFFNDKKIIKPQVSVKNYRKIPNKHLYLISLVLFILYFLLGGYNDLKAYYSGDKIKESTGVSAYFFLFCPAFLFAAIVIDFFNLRQINGLKFKRKNLGIFSVIVVLFILVSILVTGSRTVPLQIILMLFGVYCLYYKDVSFLKFFIGIIAGIALMFGVVILRGYTQRDQFAVADLVMDLVINNRSSYLAIEIVKQNGLMMGENMISPLAAPVPFLQSFFIKSGFDENSISSSRFFTEYTLGSFDGFGLGTNIIADIYLSFDFLGIIILMMGLGFFVAKSKFYAKTNIYYLAIYAIFISYAVYLVRAEFFYFLRYMIWTVLIIFFTKNKFKFS